MTATLRRSLPANARDERGRLLVFAPPIISGFLGSPLSLAMERDSERSDLRDSRRNWAKRRAY